MTVEDRRLDVLVVNQYFPPDSSATAEVFRDLVQGLVQRGHRVTVLAGRPSYAPQVRHPWRLLRRYDDAGATIERVGSATSPRNRMRYRLLAYLSYLTLATLRSLLRRRPDVVIAGTDPPVAVWAALVAARGAPVVYSLQDLHPDVAVASGMIQPGAFSRTWERLHTAALRRCAVVVCLSDAMRQRVIEKGLPQDRVEVVPNGGRRVTDGGCNAEIVAALRDDASFVALHGGNLGETAALGTLTAAAQGMNNGARLVFVGDGPKADEVRAAGVRIHPFFAEADLAAVMAAGDLQIVSLRSGMDGMVLPSKLYTILAHGRPVLAVAPADGELARFVREERCGVVADPDDPDGVVATVGALQENPDELARMAARSAELGRRFGRAETMRRFAELTEAAASAQSQRASGRR